jgi:ATP-dependent Clp protease ATP-binding subunit ClpC
MFERYTNRARRVIFHAKYEALSRGAREIEPVDIMLGLTRDPHQPDCPFAKLYDNAAELRSHFASDPAVFGPPKDLLLPLSSASKRVLAYAEKEGRKDRRYSIGSDHLLRGILRSEDPIADKIAALGYTLTTVRKASRLAHLKTPENPPRIRWWLSLHRQQLLLGAALLVVIVSLLYLHSQN